MNSDGEDHVNRMVDTQREQAELSPMDPPEAYDPPQLEAVPYEDLHPLLQGLCDEHKEYTEKMEVFEEALAGIQENGVDRGLEEKLRDVFDVFHNQIVRPGQRED